MSGWGSWLKGEDAGSSSPNAAVAPNFSAVTNSFEQDKLFGPLEKQDLEWTCAGGFATETQTWYTVLDDGSFATSQIIHSSVGLWYPQIQMTFKYFNPTTKEKIWKSVNVTKFAPQADKRSSKADQFSVTFSTSDNGDEKYTITANLDTDLQLSYSFQRPAAASGWKLGSGPKGGMSYFGTNPSSPDGYVVHRFWPTASSEGHIIAKGRAIDANGRGMFVHAIQGMRPNLVASRWNFANFQSKDLGGVSAIMMEFTTTSDYGFPLQQSSGTAPAAAGRETVTVNIGSVSVGGKLIAITASTKGGSSQDSIGSKSGVEHLDRTLDQDTGYEAPQSIRYTWEGPLLLPDAKGDVSNLVQGSIKVNLGKPYPQSETSGLVDKVDVLAEIPYMVRKLVNYVAGTKPYIYQTLNEVTLDLTLPEAYKGVGEDQGKVSVKGDLFEEHTFISS